MQGRTLTVTVPDNLYDHLQQRARERQHSIEDEVVLALSAVVSESDHVPIAVEPAIPSVAALDDDTLWRLARSRVADEDIARLAELGEWRQRSDLTRQEHEEAEELVRRHDRVMVVRAEAAAELRQRGHDIGALLTGA